MQQPSLFSYFCSVQSSSKEKRAQLLQKSKEKAKKEDVERWESTSTARTQNHLPLPIFAFFIFTFSLLISVSSAIRITRFAVPEAVEQGQTAVLSCDYALDLGEALYSIKLYKNNVEFYRYVPGENPPIQSYTLNGVYVNMTESNATHAVLTRTNLHSDGLYVCEISTEGPAFSTVRSEQLMKIYVLPSETEAVQIEGAQEQYHLGDNISLLCRTGRAHPPLRLQWFVNDVPVDGRYTAVQPAKSNESTTTYLSSRGGSGSASGNRNKTSSKASGISPQTSSLALNMVAKAADFERGGVLEIRCTATLYVLYEYESTEHLVTGSFKNKSVSAAQSRANWKREWSTVQPNLKTPTIVGMKRNYMLNDILKLNCSSSERNAQLKWFIMSREVNETHLVRYSSIGSKQRKGSPSGEVLGLWLRMEKRLVQMPELKLHCRSYSAKQMAQVHGKLQIRTYDYHNQRSWESQFASSAPDKTLSTTSVPIIAAIFSSLTFLVHFFHLFL